MYTDGIVDAQNPQDAYFGKDRLLGCVQASLGLSALQLQDKIMAGINEFTRDKPQGDDLTLIVITRTLDTID